MRGWQVIPRTCGIMLIIMRLRYNTGQATVVQFIVVMLLGFVTNAISLAGSASRDEGSFATDLLLTVFILILQAFWLGFLCVVGFAAQDKRNRSLALLLIGLEGITFMVALFNARHPGNPVALMASLLHMAIAIYVAFMAFNIYRARGKRIVSRPKQAVAGRPRRRPTTHHTTK